MIALSFSGVARRRSLAVSMVLSTALVTAVLAAFLSMARGVQLTTRGADAENIALVFRAGADAEGAAVITADQARHVLELPGIARGTQDGAQGKPLVSLEQFAIVSGNARATGAKANITFRGLPPLGVGLRPGTRLVEGRWFEPGSREVVVGRGLVQRFAGFELGGTLRFGASSWKIVGVFGSQGSVYESEIWGDDESVQQAFARGDTYQLARVQLESPAAFAGFKAALERDPGLNLEARTERDYYNSQARTISAPLMRLGWSLSLIMALGAIAGTINSMFGSVAARARDTATLRALGFRRTAVFLGTMTESMAFTLVGALVGVAVVWLLLQGFSSATVGSSLTQVVYRYSISWQLLAQAGGYALLIGFIGGLLPARSAACAGIAAGMRA